jgi:kinesin family protein C1
LQTEAAKQKNDLLKEVDGLRMELQHVREDRDNKSSELDSLIAEIGTYKEITGKTAMELDGAMTRTTALEV